MRPEPEADLRRAEDRIVGGDDEVARERQAEPAGERVPLHAGDGGLAEGVEVAEQVGELPSALVQVGEAAAVRHALEVGACAERGRARAGEHHHAHGIVGLGERERVAELADQRPRQRVAALLPIDREAGDGAIDLVAQRREALVGHGPGR